MCGRGEMEECWLSACSGGEGKGIALLLEPSAGFRPDAGAGRTPGPRSLRFLLGYYAPEAGAITVGGQPISNYDPQWWRSRVGVVMQDGVVFSETRARGRQHSGDGAWAHSGARHPRGTHGLARGLLRVG